MINMIGTVLAKAATCFRFLLKSGQNKNIDFVQIFDNTARLDPSCQYFIALSMIHSTSWNSFWSWNLYIFGIQDAFSQMMHLNSWNFHFFQVREFVLFFTAYDLFSKINHWKCNKLSKMPWSFIVSINFLFRNPHDLDNSFWICDIFKDSRPVCKYLKIGKLSTRGIVYSE